MSVSSIPWNQPFSNGPRIIMEVETKGSRNPQFGQLPNNIQDFVQDLDTEKRYIAPGQSELYDKMQDLIINRPHSHLGKLDKPFVKAHYKQKLKSVVQEMQRQGVDLNDSIGQKGFFGEGYTLLDLASDGSNRTAVRVLRKAGAESSPPRQPYHF